MIYVNFYIKITDKNLSVIFIIMILVPEIQPIQISTVDKLLLELNTSNEGILDQVIGILTYERRKTNLWIREDQTLFNERSEFIKQFFDFSIFGNEKEDFYLLTALIFTYYKEYYILPACGRECVINQMISRLILWDFWFIEYILSMKYLEFNDVCKLELEEDNIEKKDVLKKIKK